MRDREGQDSRSDVLTILLFTNLWTSLARLHFNEVALETHICTVEVLGPVLGGPATQL